MSTTYQAIIAVGLREADLAQLENYSEFESELEYFDESKDPIMGFSLVIVESWAELNLEDLPMHDFETQQFIELVGIEPKLYLVVDSY